MDLSTRQTDELHELLWQLRAGTAAPEQLSRLERLVCEDPRARAFYVRYMHLYADLYWNGSVGEERETEEAGFGDLGITGFGDLPQDVGSAVELPNHLEAGAHPSPFILHPSSLPLSSLSVGGPVFSYMVATIVLGLMLLGAWTYTITHDQHGNFVHKNSRGLTAPGSLTQQPSDLVFIGQITGLKDCRWADPRTAPFNGSYVSLGRKYVLNSGLMEISYKSGAKVILEGPCEYEVDARDGGFLSLGKLTARIEKSGRGGEREKGRLAGSTDQSPNLPLTPSPTLLFTVRTPTAIVTDLGTEFGVEVSAEGNTTSHVFSGSVRVEAGAENSVVLRENESVRVEKVGRVRETHHAQAASESVRFTHPTTPPKFVRRIVAPPMVIDLLDIVAGGNGKGRRREIGIDPTNGDFDRTFAGRDSYDGNHQYQPVTWSRFVDGVFIPDGGGSVQLDSAKHAFQGFPKTSNRTYGSIWSRDPDAPNEDTEKPGIWLYAIGRPKELMPEGRGLLGMHANVGITFDLSAMRKMSGNAGPGRFRAVAGVADARPVIPEADGSADLWVFVDGELKWNRAQLRPADGPIQIDLPLGSKDRFLTLATTDGGRELCYPWAVFGDPVLEMNAEEESKQ